MSNIKKYPVFGLNLLFLVLHQVESRLIARNAKLLWSSRN